MGRLQDIGRKLSAFLWRRDLGSVPWWQAWPIMGTRLCYAVSRDIYQGRLGLRTTSLVYTTLLSLVPILAIAFSVLKGLGVHNQIKPLLLDFLGPLGASAQEIASRIVAFVENINVEVLGGVGLVFLVYTVYSLVQKIEAALNDIWHTIEDRPLERRFSGYLTAIVLGPVLIFSTTAIVTTVVGSSVVAKILAVQPIGPLLEFVGQIVPYAIVVCVFAFIYHYVPNARVSLRSALFGGLVAGLLWQVMDWGFASYIVTSTRYPAIYATFASLVFFLIWLYLAWLVLLVGASVAFYHQNPQYAVPEWHRSRLSEGQCERIALLIMVLVGSRHYRGESNWDLVSLADRLGIAEDHLKPVIDVLLEAGLVVRTDSEPGRYVPGRAPETTLIQSVIDAMRRSDSYDALNAHDHKLLPVVEQVMGQVEASLSVALKGLTLRDLIFAMQSPKGRFGKNHLPSVSSSEKRHREA